MAAPKYDLCQWNYQNPQASGPLHVPMVVLCNTPDEEIEANVRENTARDLTWLAGVDAHDGIAVMVGGGSSVADHLDDIRCLVSEGATVFAMNAASQYLRGHGIAVDWQVTCDAKAETAGLVDLGARGHLFASHVNPATINAASVPRLWHSAIHCNEDWFPPEKKKRGGYALLGGEASTGLGALCVAYCLGFRRIEIFGYDSCHRDDQSHAYPQAMNGSIPVMAFAWAGRWFQTSVTMRTQAERFPITAQALQQAGATVDVWGDGLLQHIWTAPPENLTERDKYSKMWQIDAYRAYSPGEVCANRFLAEMRIDDTGPVIDFGCGTGRGGLALTRAGLDVTLTDFVSNCRDEEALELPFLEWDLTLPCALRAPYGYCTDVMEHIPSEDVEAVLTNIMASAETVFFQISTVDDDFGRLFLNQPLHLSVHPHDWWLGLFGSLGFEVRNAIDNENASIFIVTRKSALAA
jgi:hypothetical protein